ncbi:DUF2479 domain-containing protein [Lacticaseibacillus manihotivorans]|uniref:DUF2479 domain-containing protein n=1 Tax=Lacticaseibacillus manihotivorans TaxID=88233 RepID=A0A5P8JQQ0_9LACO|nr:BppU family phage baseplate upper protein [Lacticaseibacillus manihotivorans]QFQ91021.1 DUF2479 domain-containing protein [Lacticaseibacillus manihotivorans]
MAIRTYKVTLDSKNTIAPEPVYLRQGDKTGAVVIDATLMDNGSPVSLSGLTPMFKADTADGQAVIADSTGFTVTDSANGKFTYQVPNALSAIPGKITTAYFSLSDADGSESTFDVAFIIKAAVDISQAQADDYITIIDGTLNSLQKKIDDMNIDIKTVLNAYNQGDFYNKSETDKKDAITLSSAEKYADSGDADALHNAKDYTDNSISGIVALPETFANLAAIQAKYPNGKNGLMIAADNGHKYIWANNVWTDAGIYQSVGIADGTVTKTKLNDELTTNLSNLNKGIVNESIIDGLETFSGYINASGEIVPGDVNYVYTNMLDAIPGTVIDYKLHGQNIVTSISFFDDAMIPLLSVVFDQSNLLVLTTGTVTAPKRTRYVRYCWAKSAGDTLFSDNIITTPFDTLKRIAETNVTLDERTLWATNLCESPTSIGYIGTNGLVVNTTDTNWVYTDFEAIDPSYAIAYKVYGHEKLDQ